VLTRGVPVPPGAAPGRGGARTDLPAMLPGAWLAGDWGRQRGAKETSSATKC
jgi:hypothetical protein